MVKFSSSSSSSENGTHLPPLVSHLLAGSLAGMIAKTVNAPIDRMSLLFEIQFNNNNSSKISHRTPINYIDDTLRVYQNGGLSAFWRGNVMNVSRYFPKQAMNLAFKDYYQQYCQQCLQYSENGSVNIESSSQYRMFAGNLLSGGLASATSLLLSYPFDAARIKIAADVRTGTNQFKGIFDCLYKTITSKARVGSVYEGLSTSFPRYVIFNALFMGGYDSTKAFFELENSSVPIRFLAAQVATSIAGTVVYPMDIVKRHKEKQGNSATGTWDCLLKLLKQEGLQGLYKGLSFSLLRGFGGAILLVGYDELKELFNNL